MEYQVVTLNEKKVVGLNARTANSDPQMGAIIGSLWQTLFTQGVYGSIPYKSGTNTIGLYSDYECGCEGAYDITVGCEVEKTDPAVAGTVIKTIPAGRYAEITVDGGTVDAVAQAWNEIWKMPLERAYTADFEEYRSSADGELKEIHIFIALQ